MKAFAISRVFCSGTSLNDKSSSFKLDSNRSLGSLSRISQLLFENFTRRKPLICNITSSMLLQISNAPKSSNPAESHTGLHFELQLTTKSKFLTTTLYYPIFNKNTSLENKTAATKSKFKSEVEGSPTLTHFNNRSIVIIIKLTR